MQSNINKVKLFGIKRSKLALKKKLLERFNSDQQKLNIDAIDNFIFTSSDKYDNYYKKTENFNEISSYYYKSFTSYISDKDKNELFLSDNDQVKDELFLSDIYQVKDELYLSDKDKCYSSDNDSSYSTDFSSDYSSDNDLSYSTDFSGDNSSDTSLTGDECDKIKYFGNNKTNQNCRLNNNFKIQHNTKAKFKILDEHPSRYISDDGFIYRIKDNIKVKLKYHDACTSVRFTNRGKSHRVKNLVASYFVNYSYNSYTTIGHKDNNTNNNHYTNLTVCNNSRKYKTACIENKFNVPFYFPLFSN